MADPDKPRKPLSEEHKRKLSEAASAAHARRKAKQPPPEADKAPRPKQRSGASKRSEKRGRELRTIEAGLSELLSFPAMPAAAFGDEWAVDHFTERGPALAARITAECERNDRLRAMVLRLVEGQGYMMLAIELGLYAAPPLMHYGVLPGAERVGVPVLRRPQPQRDSSHGARQAPPAPPGPPPAPAAEGNGAVEPEAAQEAYVAPGEVPLPDAPPPIEFA